jgi:FkbM family methyltransferase
MLIVQLGANRGNDGLTQWLRNNKPEITKLILVEPFVEHHAALRECYAEFSNVTIVAAAVGTTAGSFELFWTPQDGPAFEVASLKREHVTKHYGPDADIRTTTVPVKTLSQLFDEHGITELDWLLVDAEGLDAEIVLGIDWDKYNIKRVDVEHLHLGPDADAVLKMFFARGFVRTSAVDLFGYDAAFEQRTPTIVRSPGLVHAAIPAFCINLDRRPDRLTEARKRFAQINWPMTRWPAVSLNASPYPGLSPAHAGALNSHKQIWQYCLDNKLDVVAIFEDDVLFSSDFASVFTAASKELPPDWCVWHLHSANASGTEDIGRYVLRYATTGGWGAHAYLATAAGCAKLLALSDTYHDDHRLTKCLLDSGTPPYGMVPDYTLCFQSGGGSDIIDTADLGFWQWHKDRYYR